MTIRGLPGGLAAIEAEVEALSRQYGRPERQDLHLDFGHRTKPAGSSRDGALIYDERPFLDLQSRIQARERRGEVVLLADLPGHKTIVHTKRFYPGGVYRLPSGGIRWEETALAAAVREMQEETGWQAEVEAFAGFCLFDLGWRGTRTLFPSYLFVMRLTGSSRAAPVPQDQDERIEDLREIALGDLEQVATRLESLEGSWAGWGRLRAWPHRLALRYLQQRGLIGPDHEPAQ